MSYTIQCTDVETESRMKNNFETTYFTLPIPRSPHIPKVFLRKKEGAKQITFSTTPFSIAEEKVLDCQHCHFHKIKSKIKNWLSGYHQNQNLHTHCIQNTQLAVHAKSRYCKKITYQLELLQKTFAKGDDICTNSYYFVSLPSEVVHSGHPTGSSGGFAHPLLSDKISQVVAAGITDTNEVRRSLRFCVTDARPWWQCHSFCRILLAFAGQYCMTLWG